ncbi:MAG: 50S ribosomal protein L24 [Candidatus Woesearchaeota archaeon]
MKAYSKKWKSSSKASKQKKYYLNAPLHTKRKMIKSMLSPDLKAEYGYNSAIVRAGDTIKILRGSHKGKTGKITGFSLKDKTKVYLEGFEVTRKDGSIKKVPFHHTNLMITVLKKDKKRLLPKEAGTKKENKAPAKASAKKKAKSKPGKEVETKPADKKKGSQ